MPGPKKVKQISENADPRGNAAECSKRKFMDEITRKENEYGVLNQLKGFEHRKSTSKHCSSKYYDVMRRRLELFHPRVSASVKLQEIPYSPKRFNHKAVDSVKSLKNNEQINLNVEYEQYIPSTTSEEYGWWLREGN